MTATLQTPTTPTRRMAPHRHDLHPGDELNAAMMAMEPPRKWGRVAVLALILAGVLGVLAWWAMRDYEAGALEAGLAAENAREVATFAGQFGTVELRDGSIAKLGPDTKLRIPPNFNAEVRGVRVAGTAMFSVAPGLEQAFTVLAGDARIDVQGTVFTVRAYPDESSVMVHVREGSVVVTRGETVRTLAAGQGMLLRKDGTLHEPVADDLERSVGWVDSVIVVHNVPLRDMLGVARRWFGLEFRVADEKLLDRMVSLRAPVGDIDSARKSIEASGKLRRVWEGEAQVLRAR